MRPLSARALVAIGNARWLPLAGLLLPILVLYRRLLFEGQTWLDLDFLLSYAPRYELLRSGLHSGGPPLWTDAFLGGFPVAFSEFGWFYPVTWLFLMLLPMPLAYHAETVFGLLLAGLAAYWLGRLWGLSRLASFLAGFLYAMGPFVFATSRFLNYADVFFVLPAAVAAIENVARGRMLFVPLLAVVLAIAILAGHPQIALMLVGGAGVFALFRLAWTYRDRGELAAIKLLGLLAVAVVIALAAGAPRLLPLMDVTSDSTRAGGLDFATAAGGSTSPLGLVLGFFYPGFDIPRALDGQLRAEPLAYAGLLAVPLVFMAVFDLRAKRPVLFLVVLAAIALILAMGSFTPAFGLLHSLPLWGFFRQPGRFIILASFAIAFLSAFGLDALRAGSIRHQDRLRPLARILAGYAVFLLAASTLATVFIAPPEGPVRDLANRAIDRFLVGGRARYVTELEYEGTFAQTVQALQGAFALASWTTAFAILFAALSALVLWGYARGRWTAAAAPRAAAAVLAADVFLSLGHGIDTIPVRETQTSNSVIEIVSTSPATRVFSFRGLADKWELSVGAGSRLSDTERLYVEYIFLREVLTPNLPMQAGLASIDGYENLMSRRQAEILAYLGSERTPLKSFASDPNISEIDKGEMLRRRDRALTALNVGTVLSGTSFYKRGATKDGTTEKGFAKVEFPPWAQVQQTLWKLDQFQPPGMAFLTDRWLQVDQHRSTAEMLRFLELMPYPDVVLDADPGLKPWFTYDDSKVDINEPPGRILDSASTATHRVYRVDVERHSLFVMNSFVTNGWKLKVDGKDANYLIANRFGAAIPLGPGLHTLEFRYSPPHWSVALPLGVGAGAAIAALTLGAVLWRVKFGPRTPSPSP